MAARAERFAPNETRVAAETVDGEAILIDLDTGVYYSMDGVAGLIWTLVEQRCSVQEIVDALAGRYAVEPLQARRDTERVLDTLLREQLIAPTMDHPPPDAQPRLDERLPYSTPEVQIFRDMSALLALDPPLPGLTTTPWQAEP